MTIRTARSWSDYLFHILITAILIVTLGFTFGNTAAQGKKILTIGREGVTIFTRNFNPFSPNSVWGTTTAIYERMIMHNRAKDEIVPPNIRRDICVHEAQQPEGSHLSGEVVNFDKVGNVNIVAPPFEPWPEHRGQVGCAVITTMHVVGHAVVDVRRQLQQPVHAGGIDKPIAHPHRDVGHTKRFSHTVGCTKEVGVRVPPFAGVQAQQFVRSVGEEQHGPGHVKLGG